MIDDHHNGEADGGDDDASFLTIKVETIFSS